MKLTRDQLESRKQKAVRLVRDVLDDSDRAQEIESESLDDYAARRKIQLLNPTGRKKLMVKKTQTREELKERVRELEEENETLQDQLDAIADIVVPAEGEEGEEEEEEEEEED